MLTEELMREVRRLEIRARRRVSDLFAGEYHSAFKGQGIEFADVREYEPGDDVRSIDWNVTARAGKPFIKRFAEERQLSVMLVVDLSASGLFGSGEKSKARLMAEMGAVLALAAARNNDRVGLMTFSDQVELFIPPRKGRNGLLRLMRELLDAEPRAGGRAFADALSTLRGVLDRHSIVFVVSDFLDDLGEPDWELPLRLLARKHDVVALRVSDPRERDLPPMGLLEVEDPETGRRTLLETSGRSRRARRRKAAEAHERRLRELLGRDRVDLVSISTDRSFVNDLARYFHQRERSRG
ncbi:MAG: DUF58 domain-containing protein [Phycisphaerales bacterium JB059]